MRRAWQCRDAMARSSLAERRAVNEVPLTAVTHAADPSTVYMRLESLRWLLGLECSGSCCFSHWYTPNPDSNTLRLLRPTQERLSKCAGSLEQLPDRSVASMRATSSVLIPVSPAELIPSPAFPKRHGAEKKN